MRKFLTNRASILPVLMVAVVIAVVATLVIVLASPSSGGGSSSPSAAPGTIVGGKSRTVSVDISMFAFSPSTVTVAAGTTVAWTNKDTTEHTASADDGMSFDTGAIQHGQTKTFTFMKPGTYRYHCAFHPFMLAKVIVR